MWLASFEPTATDYGETGFSINVIPNLLVKEDLKHFFFNNKQNVLRLKVTNFIQVASKLAVKINWNNKVKVNEDIEDKETQANM